MLTGGSLLPGTIATIIDAGFAVYYLTTGWPLAVRIESMRAVALSAEAPTDVHL